MIYFILFIIILTIILYFITKDIKLVLELSGKITIFSGILSILIGIFFRYFINNNIININLSSISFSVFVEFVRVSLILISLGFFELSCVKIIKYWFILRLFYLKYKKTISF